VALKTTTLPKTRCRKPYAATQHLCSWWWAYVPETCRAKNTSIKLPSRIKLAFHFISWGRCMVKQPSTLYCNHCALHKNKNICCLHIYINKTHKNITNIQNPCSIFLLHKLTAVHLAKNTTPSTEPKWWLQCMEEKSTHSYNQTYKSSPHLPFYILKAKCILTPYLTIRLLRFLLSSKLLNKTL